MVFYSHKLLLKFDISVFILYHITIKLGRNFQTRPRLVFVVFSRKVVYGKKNRDIKKQTVCADYPRRLGL
jgi:hypothetical protein